MILRLAVFVAALVSFHVSAHAQPSDSCLSLVVPYQAWSEPADPEWTFRASTASGALLYIGAEHSRDLAHQQFTAIEKAFRDFQPTIVFYEGPNRPIASTRDETITSTGESGFARFLAAQAGIPVARLEPEPQDEARYVLERYPDDQVMLFYVLRQVAQLRERNGASESDLKEAAAQLLERVGQVMPDIELSIRTTADLEKAYHRYWHEPAGWWEAPMKWFDPDNEGSETGGIFTNEINRASSHFRDLNMTRVLADAVRQGHRVFAVVGRNHVPMQAPALECYLRSAD